MTQILKINTSEETRYDFDVSINGLDEKSNPEVRFVIESAEFDTAVKCSKNQGGGWSVCIPALPLTETSGFKVEVIVDGYYFIPVSGGLQIVSSPKVGLKETFTSVTAEKPTVSASFGASATKAPVLEAAATGRVLLEFADIDRAGRAALTRQVKSAARVFNRAAELLETAHGYEEINLTAVSGIINAVKKTIASVEVTIYE